MSKFDQCITASHLLTINNTNARDFFSRGVDPSLGVRATAASRGTINSAQDVRGVARTMTISAPFGKTSLAAIAPCA